MSKLHKTYDTINDSCQCLLQYL